MLHFLRIKLKTCSFNSLPTSFFFQFLIMFAASLGMKTLSEFYNKRSVIAVAIISCVIPLIIYGNFVSIMSFFEISVNRKTTRPFRNEVRYWAVPWKHNEFSAERFAAAALNEAAPDGTIMADSTAYHSLALVQERDQKYTGVNIQSVLGLEQDCSVSEYRKIILSNSVYTVLPEPTFFPEIIQPHIKFIRNEGSVLYRAVWNEKVP